MFHRFFIFRRSTSMTSVFVFILIHTLLCTSYDHKFTSDSDITQYLDISGEITWTCRDKPANVRFISPNSSFALDITDCRDDCGAMRPNHDCGRVDQKITESFQGFYEFTIAFPPQWGLVSTFMLYHSEFVLRWTFVHYHPSDSFILVREINSGRGGSEYMDTTYPTSISKLESYDPFIFNNYGILFTPDKIEFYVNGVVVGVAHEDTDDFPTEDMRYRVDFHFDDCDNCDYRGFVSPGDGEAYSLYIKRVRYIEGATAYPRAPTAGEIVGTVIGILAIICAVVCYAVPIIIVLVVVMGIGSVHVFRRVKETATAKPDDARRSVVLRKFRELEDKETNERMTAEFNLNANLFKIKIEELDVKSKIGRGGFATVFLCEYHNTLVAFKSFETKSLFDTDFNFQSFEKELELISSLSHKNLCRFYGACLCPPRAGIVMEYCKNGDIEKYIKDRTNDIEDTVVIRFCVEIAVVMEFLHSKKVIHRDLKPSNAILDDTLTVKVIDFGLSKIIDESQRGGQTQQIGTSIYMAPEVAKGTLYDLKADVFSFALILYCCLCRNFEPYGTQDFNIHIRVSTDADFRPDLDKVPKSIYKDYEPLIELMRMCWQHEKDHRPAFATICEVFKRMSKKGHLTDPNENNRRRPAIGLSDIGVKKAKPMIPRAYNRKSQGKRFSNREVSKSQKPNGLMKNRGGGVGEMRLKLKKPKVPSASARPPSTKKVGKGRASGKALKWETTK